MSIIKQDQKRLDNIAKAYWNTSGEMRKMWGRKWYELIKQIGRNFDEFKKEFFILKKDLSRVAWDAEAHIDNYYQEFVIEGAEYRKYKHKWLERVNKYYEIKRSTTNT